MRLRRIVLLTLSGFSVASGSRAHASLETVAPAKQEVKIDEMAEACARSPQKDQICQLVVQIRQIGNDAIEAVKQYAALTEAQYTLLTIANAMATQRIRLKTGLGSWQNAGLVLDVQRDQTQFLIEKSF